MFPSANYFRDIPCPFFSRVACPRPHCHFKHVQTSSSSSNLSNNSSSIGIPPDANETLNKLINQLSSAAGANSTTTNVNPTPPVDLNCILHSTLLQSLTTAFANALNATPSSTSNVSEKLTQAISNIATQINQQQTQTTTSNAAETVPQYRPTPIAELERRRRVQQTAVRPTIKTEPIDFDSDEYMQATFSPPSTSPPPTPVHQSEIPEEIKSKVSTIPKSIASNLIPKPSSITGDTNHSWVTPPVRRKLSSSSEHHDVDERKTLPAKKSTVSASIKLPIQPASITGKPKVIEKINKIPSVANPMVKPIPKKTIPSKVRLVEIDLDRVPVTSTISLDIDTETPLKTLKRPSNGTNGIVQKKAKITPTIKPTISTTVRQTVKKTLPIPNGTGSNQSDDKDTELALFDFAFSSSKPSETSISSKKPTPMAPPNSVQQLTARYSSVSTSSASLANNRTRAETSSDGRRVAHQPKVHSNPSQSSFTPLLQPLVDPNSSSNKIPFKTRQEYLNFFLTELKKQANKSNDSTPTPPVFSRAQTIEKDIFDKSTNKNSYLNLAAKYVRQLRTDDTPKTEQISPKKAPAQRLVVSHSAMLTGGRTDNVSFGIKKQKQIDLHTLTDNEIYTLLLPYKASEHDLLENGYPAFSLDFPDKVLIKNKNPIYNSTIKIPSSDPNSRTCCRCGKAYKVNQDGEYLTSEECIYHWGRLRSQRVAGQIQKNYSCCGSNSTAFGCAVSQYHVNNGDDTQLLPGYVKTQPVRKQLSADESYGVFALDCEMCYTINGLELVRVSIVNHKLQSVFESYIKPHHDVLDYNTRWSGISEHDLRDCHVRLEDVQRRLLKLFNEKSILIGHSLESDLKALKIVHETIVDTSLVFPHAKGKPYKRALKNLMTEHLNKTIQASAEGHDSIEDAIACMELMLWKVKEDLRSTAVNR